MNLPLANFWGGPNNSAGLLFGIFGAFLFGMLLIAVFMQAPPRSRRFIIGVFTFLSGLVYVLYFLWPQNPKGATPTEGQGMVKDVAFWLRDAIPVAGGLAQIILSFLLGLGMYSLIGIHLKRLLKGQKDSFFSAVLLISLVLMVAFGYANWYITKIGPHPGKFEFPENWGVISYTFNFLFDGLLQQMDAAMFSIIAFYILSAAYRAFRVRSVEATILLAAALLMMLSLMGAVEGAWNSAAESMAHGNGFLLNFKLTEIASFIRENFQNPGIRALEFGVGIGALAMGLRLWLSLERGGLSS